MVGIIYMKRKYDAGEFEGSNNERTDGNENLGVCGCSLSLPNTMRMKDPTSMIMAWKVSV